MSDERHAPWAPPPVEEVVEAIERTRPEVVFAAHVETAAGMVLPDDYVRAVAAATHDIGGLLVLDCIASGAIWVDMTDLGVDVLLSAPQKGWSGSPCAGYVMLGEAGARRVRSTTSTSFAADLGKWLTITEAYIEGQTPYHVTMPTDTLAHNAALMRPDPRRRARRAAPGPDRPRHARPRLAGRARVPVRRGGADSRHPAWWWPTPTTREIRSGAKFKQVGVQAAAGVPLMCGEGDDFSSFRIGLFGLDKLADVDGTVARLEARLDQLDR